LFHYFDRFLAEYEGRFEKEYGFFRPIVKEVVERYLDCGNPRCGFARIRCPDCHAEHLLMFSCRTRGFCPSCHAKRLEQWGEWMREELLLDVPHRQVVFTIPRMLGTTPVSTSPAWHGRRPRTRPSGWSYDTACAGTGTALFFKQVIQGEGINQVVFVGSLSGHLRVFPKRRVPLNSLLLTVVVNNFRGLWNRILFWDSSRGMLKI
jgi:ribosomal protein S27E